jgi:hypothetical protein
MKQGEAALKPQGANSFTKENEAITRFLEASKVAPDDDRKFQALARAAETSVTVKDFQRAIELYDAARALPKISAEQKARAQYGYAAGRHRDAEATYKPLDLVASIQADYEAALKLPALPVHLQMEAHEAIGDLLILQGQRMSALKEYQKILDLPGAKLDSIQNFYLNRMAAELHKVAVSPEAVALADATLKQLLALQKKPDDITAVKNDFTKIFLAQNQPQRAIVLWNQIADDKSLPLPSRAGALREVSATQLGLKNWSESLAAADHLGTLTDATSQLGSTLAAWRGWDRAAVFRAQGDEAKARAEWEAMIALPQVSPEEKGRAWMEIAASYERAAKAAPNDATLVEARKKAYESAWNLEGAHPGTRAQALLDRGQMEIDAKNSAAATTLLLDGLKAVEGWKGQPELLADIKREFNFALATVYRSDKSFDNATAALVQAQQYNKENDPKIASAEVAVSQEAFAAKQWDAARNALAALKDTWGVSRKVYLINLVQVEVADQKWADAKKMLDEIATLNPTPAETTTLDKLRAKIPAA